MTATLTGAGKVLGDLAAIGFILALLSSGTTWIMGADRAQAVAGFDGAAPRSFGYFSARWGTPIVVNLLSGVFSTIVMVLAFQLTSGNAEQVLHRRARPGHLDHDDRLPRRSSRRSSSCATRTGTCRGPTACPAGWWACGSPAACARCWAALATVALLYPGFGTAHPDSSLPDGWAGQRGAYEVVAVRPARGADRHRPDLLRARRADAGARRWRSRSRRCRQAPAVV